MKCQKCGISVFDEPLYRNAPKGVIPANWRCISCLDPEYMPEESVIKDTARISKGLINKKDRILP